MCKERWFPKEEKKNQEIRYEDIMYIPQNTCCMIMSRGKKTSEVEQSKTIILQFLALISVP